MKRGRPKGKKNGFMTVSVLDINKVLSQDARIEISADYRPIFKKIKKIKNTKPESKIENTPDIPIQFSLS